MPLTHELLSLDNGLGRAQRQHGGRIASSARRSAGGADFCGLLANLLDNALEHPPAGLGERNSIPGSRSCSGRAEADGTSRVSP